MNTEVEHKGLVIDLQLYDAPQEVVQGWLHFAILKTACTREELKNLIGLELWGKKVIDVERYEHHSFGWKLGLVTKEKMWSGK